MLKNKKKLRRIERRTPGYAARTAQTLVLAGALVGALTLGGAGMAAAAPITGLGVQDNWSQEFRTNTSIATTNMTVANGTVYSHAEGMPVNTPLTIGDLKVGGGNGANPDVSLMVNGILNAKAISVFGGDSLSVYKGSLTGTALNLGSDATAAATAGTAGTLNVGTPAFPQFGVEAVAGTLTINGDTQLGGKGFDEGAAVGIGGNGTLTLNAGTAHLNGAVTLGGAGGVGKANNNTTAGGVGGDGAIMVGADATLQVDTTKTLTIGGVGGKGGAGGAGAAGSTGGNGGVGGLTTASDLTLGTVQLGGLGGVGGSDSTGNGGAGGNGGVGTLTIDGGKTTIDKLLLGGTGGKGGTKVAGTAGAGGAGGTGTLTLNAGELLVTGVTTITGAAGAQGDNTGGAGGAGGVGTLAIAGGTATFDGKVSVGSSATNANFNIYKTGTNEAPTAKINGELAIFANANSVVNVGNGGGNGGTLDLSSSSAKLTIGTNGLLNVNGDGVLDLGARNATLTIAANDKLAAAGLTTATSTGNVTMNGGLIKTEGTLVTSGAIILGNTTSGGTEVDASLEAKSLKVGTAGGDTLGINSGNSLKLTDGTAGYLNSGAVTLTQGTLDVAGDISVSGASEIKLTDAKSAGSDVTVTVGTAAVTKIITSGNAYASNDVTVGGANLGAVGSLFQAKTLDTTYDKVGGTNTAAGKDVTVNGGTLRLTQDAADGIVLNLGTGKALVVNNAGTLDLTGNVIIGAITGASNASVLKTLSSVTSADDKISFSQTASAGTDSTLKISGLATYNNGSTNNLTISNTAGTDTFGSKLVVGGLKAGVVEVVNSGSLSLTGLGEVTDMLQVTSLTVKGGTTGGLTLGGDESYKGFTSKAIAVGNSTAGLMTLKQGNFETGAISVAETGSKILIGAGGDIGTAGSLKAPIALADNGEIVMNGVTGSAVRNAYTIEGNVTLGGTSKITSTAGDLTIKGTLDVNSSNAAAIATSANSNLTVDTLKMTNNGAVVNVAAGTLKVGTLTGPDTGAAGAKIVVSSTGTLDLDAQNVKNLYNMTNTGTAGSMDVYKGVISFNGGTLKTTGTVNYDNATALTINNTAGQALGTFKGKLNAGVLNVTKGDGKTLWEATVVGNNLTLTGNGQSFLNASKLTVDNGGLALGSKEWAQGGTSAASLVLGGATGAGNLNVGFGKFVFNGTDGITTGASNGSVSIANDGTLQITKVGTLTGNLSFSVGESLATDGSKGTLVVTDAAGLNNAKVSLNVNTNGRAVFGSADAAWVDNTLKAYGVTGAPAVLAVSGSKTLDLSTASWRVNSDTPNTFGDNSLTIIDPTGFSTDKAAIKVTSANFGKDAKLLLAADKIVSGHTILALQSDNKTTQDMVDSVNGKWVSATTNNRLFGLDVTRSADGKQIFATTNVTNPMLTMPGISGPMAGLLMNMANTVGVDVNSANAGIRFASRVADRSFLYSDSQAAPTIEGAAQMGAVAGVQISTIGAAQAASGAALTRTSFAQPLMDMTKAVAVNQDVDGNLSLDTGLSAGDGMKNGLGVWIMPLYQSNRTWGQKAENFKSGMSSDLGGIALGADYTINDMFRFGAAFNVGGGYAESSGDFNKTDNNFNFWGVNLYGGWTMNNFGLSADVGYTSNYNKVEQDVPSSMLMGNLKSDITSSAWTAGLKGEYKFETSVVDIIPHIGVRYMGLTTDSYDVKSGGTVFSVERDFQSIWTFPIGVAFNKTITTDSGWMFKPQVDLSVIPAAGDIKAKSKASIPGVMGDAEMKMQVVDYVTFDGGVGLEMGKDNLSFGINYNIQASEHRTGHGVFGTLRYEF